jgi:hypothetical protein
VELFQSLICNSLALHVVTVLFEVILLDSRNVVDEELRPHDVLEVKIEPTTTEFEILRFFHQSLNVVGFETPFAKSEVGHDQKNFLSFLVGTTVHHLFASDCVLEVHQSCWEMVENEVADLEGKSRGHDEVGVVPAIDKSFIHLPLIELILSTRMISRERSSETRAGPISCIVPKSDCSHARCSCRLEFSSKCECDLGISHKYPKRMQSLNLCTSRQGRSLTSASGCHKCNECIHGKSKRRFHSAH